MSFGESVFLARFNQKTAKEDLVVKGNHGIPPRNWHGKTLGDSIEAEAKPLPGRAGRRHLEIARPLVVPPVILVAMSVLHRLLGCIYAVYSSQFDLRA
jgi:hypothetical protein